MLSDYIIRGALLSNLNAQYKHCKNTVIFEEFAVPRPSGRIDIAVINGLTSGFEIKSDQDSLTRLHHQVPAFNSFFEQMILVTTKKHITKARQKIPYHWGLILACNDQNHVTIRNIRKPRTRSRINLESQLHCLTMLELRAIAAQIYPKPIAYHQLLKDALVEELLSTGNRVFLIEKIKNILKKRASKMSL